MRPGQKVEAEWFGPNCRIILREERLNFFNPLVPRVVMEKPQFLGDFFLKTLCVEISDTIYSI